MMNTQQSKLRLTRNPRIWLTLSLALIIIAAATGIGLSGLLGQEIPRDSVRVENKSGSPLQTMGLIYEGQALLHKSGTGPMRQALFPKALLGDTQAVQLIGITPTGEVMTSASVSVAGERPIIIIIIEHAADGRLRTGGAAQDDQPEVSFELPDLNQWEITQSGKLVQAAFRADTELAYKVYMLGKGGMLAPSDLCTAGERATASWERGRGPMMSWLLLKSE